VDLSQALSRACHSLKSAPTKKSAKLVLTRSYCRYVKAGAAAESPGVRAESRTVTSSVAAFSR